jgi:hypothetical protein
VMCAPHDHDLPIPPHSINELFMAGVEVLLVARMAGHR